MCEAAHSTLRREEEQHRMNIVRRIGTPIHQYRSLKSLTMHKSTKIGGHVDSTFTNKYVKSSSTPSPSPLSFSSPSPTQVLSTKRSPFDLNFPRLYPAAIAANFSSSNK